jgi:DNA modification methylase
MTDDRTTHDEWLNKIACMDALEFMRGLPDGCVDLVVVNKR